MLPGMQLSAQVSLGGAVAEHKRFRRGLQEGPSEPAPQDASGWCSPDSPNCVKDCWCKKLMLGNTLQQGKHLQVADLAEPDQWLQGLAGSHTVQPGGRLVQQQPLARALRVALHLPLQCSEASLQHGLA